MTISASMLRKAREEAELSQSGLARAAEMSQSEISRFELGDREVTETAGRKIAVALGFDWDEWNATATDEEPEGPVTSETRPRPSGADGPPAPDDPTPTNGKRKQGLLGRFRRRPEQAAAPGREKPPKRVKGYSGRRQSSAELFEEIFDWGGGYFQRAGRVPTGRMLAFEAPIAGEMLDEAVKGTALDRYVVQRVVGVKGKIDLAMAVVAPPMLTMAIENALAQGNTDRAAFLQDMLASQLRKALPLMVPHIKKVRAKEKAETEALADLLDEDLMKWLGVEVIDGQLVKRDADGVPHKIDAGQVMVGMLFQGWTVPTVVVDAESEEVSTDVTTA